MDMQRMRKIDEIDANDLLKINECLVQFDNYLQDVTRKATDENVALYEHWIDCMADIQAIITKSK